MCLGNTYNRGTHIRATATHDRRLYGGPIGRAMCRLPCDDVHATIDDVDATIDDVDVTIDNVDVMMRFTM